MKLMFPIALMMAWVVMVALTVADFAGFYAATAQAYQQPAAVMRAKAVEVVRVQGRKPAPCTTETLRN